MLPVLPLVSDGRISEDLPLEQTFTLNYDALLTERLGTGWHGRPSQGLGVLGPQAGTGTRGVASSPIRALVCVPAAFVLVLGSTAAPGMSPYDALRGTANQHTIASNAPRRVTPAKATALLERTPAILVRTLHDASGLTWEQLARLVGVSRRSIHAWATGARLTAHHQERLAELYTVITDLGGGDARPSRVRDLLLEPKAGGSLFDQIRRESSRDNVSGATLTPTRQMFAMQ